MIQRHLKKFFTGVDTIFIKEDSQVKRTKKIAGVFSSEGELLEIMPILIEKGTGAKNEGNAELWLNKLEDHI